MDILNSIEGLFEEISLLYTSFDNEPLDGLKILRGDDNAIEDLKIKYRSLPEEKQYQSPSYIVFLNVRKIGVNNPDVWRWLYHNRIEILHGQVQSIKNELGHVLESKFIVIRLREIIQILKRLQQTLTSFAGKGQQDFQNLESNADVDWSKIFHSLNGYLPYVMGLTRLYINLINLYLPDAQETNSSQKSQFKSSKIKGTKTDLIRILSALYDLRLIELENGQLPKKEQFMKQIGGFLGVDMNRYEQALSLALDQPLETNLRVFDELKQAIQAQVLARQGNGRK